MYNTRQQAATNAENENQRNALKNGVVATQAITRRPFQDVGNVNPSGYAAPGFKAEVGHGYATRHRTNQMRTQAAPAPSHQPASSMQISYTEMLDRRAEEGRRASLAPSTTANHVTRAASQRRAHAAPSLPDIDSADKSNPLAVTDYVNDILAYCRRVEPSYMPPADYIRSQADINEKMRGILVDWLVEVHLKFKLMPETLYLTVSCIDRFLAKKQVTRKNLQLVGVTAMLIASKYEEIWAPEVRDFVYISDKAYTRDQILGMEKVMLNTLGFHLTVPTPYLFLSRYIKAARGDRDTHTLALYLMELALVDYSMVKYSGSLLAASAVYVAMRCRTGQSENVWTPVLEQHTRYPLPALADCAADLARLLKRAPTNTLAAVYKKYCNAKFNEIARTVNVDEDLLAGV